MHRLIKPGLATLAALMVLLTLGTWQLQRLAWKQDLLAQIDAAEQRAPAAWTHGLPAFSRVRVEGTFRPDIIAWYGTEGRTTRGGPAIGAHLLGVLDRADGGTVLVDRGWVPLGLGPPPPRDRVTIDGWLRPAEQPGLFSATDNPATRHFYTLDPAAISRELGIADVAPFVLVAMGPQTGWDQPAPAQALPRPKNDHLMYALTWYSLALVLLGVFAVFARKLLRAP